MPEAKLTQKVCPRCRSIYAGTMDELVCPTCQASLKRADTRKAIIRKQNQNPINPWLECTIKREGPTTVSIGGCTYTFRTNEHGDSVCKIINNNHYKFLTKSGHYRPYVVGEP